MKLGRLLEGITDTELHGSPAVNIGDIHYDSRAVRPGDMFVAIRGFVQDGHRYVGDALQRGATAVVVEDPAAVPPESRAAVITVSNGRSALAVLSARLFGDPSKQLRVIGVTGTNGKTTTTHLVRTILEHAGRPSALIGTIHNIVNGQALPVQRTTPEAPDLMRLMRAELQGGGRYAVMEASSHALALGRVAGCEFDVGVFTNLSQDHIGEVHRDLEDYISAKLTLFEGLGKTYSGVPKQGAKYAVINRDDAVAERFAAVCSVPVVTYGLHPGADVTARGVEVHSSGVTCTVHAHGSQRQLRLRLTGRFNVYNALAALSVGLGEGLPLNDVCDALESVDSVEGRFQSVNAGQPFAVIVDYAHTPDGLENILRTAREFTRGRVIVVFGAGGDRDRGKRPIMGRIAAELGDYCIVTSDNPRSEEPAAIIHDVEAGMQDSATPREAIIDRETAIERAIALAGAEDTVILAGKGHETYQVFADHTIDFDDREVARRAIAQLGRGST